MSTFGGRPDTRSLRRRAWWFGGVLTEFHRAEFTEYDTCVVGHPITSQRQAPPGTAIRLVLISTTVTGHLTSLLGGRVLLTEAGTPIAALPNGHNATGT